MVWKNTKRIGCAWNTKNCKSNGANFYKLVCEYDPPGNVVGGNNFRDNVPRPVRKAGVEDVENEINSTSKEEVEQMEGQAVIEL